MKFKTHCVSIPAKQNIALRRRNMKSEKKTRGSQDWDTELMDSILLF